MLLNGDPLPWVEEVKHLGNVLESDSSMARDITIKRAKFIGKLNSLSQEFHYVSPQVFIKIPNIYAVSFHGSGLWDIFSPNCERLYKVKTKLKYFDVPEDEGWRLGPILELLNENLKIPGLT